MMKRFFIASIFIFLVAIPLFNACNAQNKKGEKSSRVEGVVKEVDESFFKKNISDYSIPSEDFIFKGDKPIVVDFYATWCGPCKKLSPKMKKMAEKYAGEVEFVKMDIDKNPEITSVYGIRSVPTILFIPVKGKPYLSQGNLPEDKLEEMISKIYQKKK